MLVLCVFGCGGVVREPGGMDPPEDTSTGEGATGTTEDESTTDPGGERGWDDSWNDGEFRTVTVDGMTIQLSEDQREANPGRQTASSFATPAGIGNWFESPSALDAKLAELDPPRGVSTHAYYYYRERADANELRSIFAYLSLSPGAVDLSAYAGFGFWARFDDASAIIYVRADPGSELGTPAPGYTLRVSDEWAFYFVSLESLEIAGSVISELHFIVGDQGESGTFWIDDFGFVCDGDCP